MKRAGTSSQSMSMLRLPIEYNNMKGQPPKARRIATFLVVDLVFCYGVERYRPFKPRTPTLLELLHLQMIAELSFVSCNRLSFDSAESAENAVDTMKSSD